MTRAIYIERLTAKVRELDNKIDSLTPLFAFGPVACRSKILAREVRELVAQRTLIAAVLESARAKVRP